MISISALNSIRFRGILDYDFHYADGGACYFQKYQTSDRTFIQLRSDEEDVPYRVVGWDSNVVVTSGMFSKIDTAIAGHTFKIFQTEIFFNIFTPGKYKIMIGANDEFESFGIHIEDEHPDTMLVRYRNSQNDFGVVFDTDVIFDLRVESQLNSYTPKSDTEIYNDQRRNAVKLYGLPYNVFTYYVGGAKGIPDWMLDTVNRAFACDMIKINDHWFELTEGAEWEVNRIPDYPYASMSIEVMPSNNNVLEKLRFDGNSDLEDWEYMIIQRYSHNFTDVTGSVSLLTVFQKNMVINYITVLRKGAPYELKVGITDGGEEIGSFFIEQPLQVITLNYRFDDAQPLYLTGLDGLNDVSIVWDRLDRFFNPLDVSGEPQTGLGKNAVVAWEGSLEDFEIQFNVVTGLGRQGGDWYGWAICNGQNGTKNMAGKFVVGWGSGVPRFGTIGAQAGGNGRYITVENLPEHHFNLFANDTSSPAVSSDINENSYVAKGTTTRGSRDEKYAMRHNGNVASVGRTNSIGSGQQLDIVPDSIVMVYVKKII